MAIANNCTPRLIQVDDSCGCTLTRANIKPWSSVDVEEAGLKELGMDRIIGQTKEARRTGVIERSLTDLFLSRTIPMKKQSMVGDHSIIAPYFYVPQRHNINANYFVVDAGVVNPTAGVGSMPASAWDLTVKNHAGLYASPLVSLERYFLPGRFIVVLNKDTGTGIGRSLQYKIIAAANADAGGVSKATITVEPNFTPAGWTALAGGDKTIYQATHGVVIPLANSVSDYESWCYQDPAENTLKLRTYWWQNIRETHCYNDEYLKALNAPLMGTMWKNFKTQTLAQQRKRQSALAERAFYHTVFFGQQANDDQTEANFNNTGVGRGLPRVVDPANTTCLIEWKANTIGARQQLADCGRVTDLQGGQLDIDVIKATLNNLKRHREIDSGQITRIDAMTDRYTASNILQVMIDYYKRKYGVDTTRFYKVGEKLSFENIVLWEYNIYEFPDEQIQMAVFTDTFFDDYLNAFPAADKSRGRFFFLIDWSDFAIALGGSASVARNTNLADNLYNCVISPIANHYQLTSKMIAVMLQDPNRHNLIENFSEACPKITVSNCVAASA